MCGPLCPIGLIGGMALARWLGVSDLVLGLWIGALIVSATVVTVKWLAKYGKDFKGSFATIFLLTIAITAFSVRKQLLWHGPGLILWLPPVVAGIVSGAFAIFIIDAVNKWVIARNDGKVYFPYQKLVAPLVGILAVSLIIHFFFS
ncbi:MAG: hypothetical protein WCJ25_01010 [Candidatus Moraniibacteriota bacterium]